MVKWYLLFILKISVEVRTLPHAYLHAYSRHFCSGDYCRLLWLWDPEKECLLSGLLVCRPPLPHFFSCGWYECLSAIWLIIMMFYLGVDKCHLLCKIFLLKKENPTVSVSLSVSRWGCQVSELLQVHWRPLVQEWVPFHCTPVQHSHGKKCSRHFLKLFLYSANVYVMYKYIGLESQDLG